MSTVKADFPLYGLEAPAALMLAGISKRPRQFETPLQFLEHGQFVLEGKGSTVTVSPPEIAVQ